jgi:conflict system STAND superfamily ATPase
MGRLSGVLAQSADRRLQELVAEDAAYEETARHVFLRMVICRSGIPTRHKVSRDELVYSDDAENARVETLLTTFEAARLLVSDRGEWEPAHDGLVQSWPTMSTWCEHVGDALLTLQSELADAVRRWKGARRPELLWHGDARLRKLQRADQGARSWLNAREREFVARSRRRARRMYYIATALPIIIVMGGAVLWYLFYRPHVRYFASYVRHWGEPTGVDLLDDAEAHARTTSVKLVRRGRLGHTVHVELTRNGEVLAKANRSGIAAMPELEIGQPVEGERMPCQWDFEYDADTGDVSAETARDRHGRVSYVLQYHGGPRDAHKAEFLDRNRFSARVKRGDAELVEFVRSPQGLDIEKRYFSRMGTPARDENGVSIEKFRYDANHVIEISFFDPSGKPLRTRYGYAGWQSRFADKGNEIQRIYFDEAGRPTRHRDGYAGWQSTFDGQGNEIECEYRNERGERTRHRNGPAGWRGTFDGRGREIERAYFDEAGLPAQHIDGYASQRSSFDGRDNEIERSYFDELGRPARHTGGYAGWRSAFDEHGNEIKRDYLDDVGAPLLTDDGYAGWRSHFDELGNETERHYIDKEGQLVTCTQGYAGWRSTFNAWDDEIEHTYFDRFDRPAILAEGVAGWRSEFDDRGHEVKREYIDAAGRLSRSAVFEGKHAQREHAGRGE